MKPYIQEPPFCIQVELTEGCNLQCSFCGIQGIREKAGGPFKFMTEETAIQLSGQIAKAGWTSRIEFAMHGEPSMNQKMQEIITWFRWAVPKNQLMMTSNGAGFLKNTTETINGLFNNGLNILALDDYENVNIVPKVLERYTGPVQVVRYPEEGLELSPHRRWPKNTKVIIVIRDITKADEGSHNEITNHCGCGGPLNFKRSDQRCAKPFREIGVRWDGSIAGCCNDWRGVVKVGNIHKTDIAQLWNGEVFGAMRRKLLAGQRDFGACIGCDYRSYRNGLLPDKLGKKKLPAPTAQDNEILRRSTLRGTYTPAVIRPWEIKRK